MLTPFTPVQLLPLSQALPWLQLTMILIKVEMTMCAGLFPPEQGKNLETAVETLRSRIRILWIHEGNLVHWDPRNPTSHPNDTTKGTAIKPGLPPLTPMTLPREQTLGLGSLTLKCWGGDENRDFLLFAPKTGEPREAEKQNGFFLTLTLQ